MKISNNDLKKFLDTFSDKKIRYKSLNDILTYDGRAIWWFFKLMFTADNIPKGIGSFDDLVRFQGFTLKQKINSLVLRKLMKYNELLKIRCSRPEKKEVFSGKKRILFFTHTNALTMKDDCVEIDKINDLYSLMLKDRDVEPVLSVVQPLSFRFSRKLPDFSNLAYSFADKGIIETAKKESVKLRKKWIEARKKLIFSGKEKKIFAILENAIDFYLSREMIFLIILYYLAFDRLLKQKNIDGVVFYSASGIITRCALAAAEKNGIKSYILQHAMGLYYDNPDALNARHLVIGEEYKEIMSSLGVKRENIFVVGPLFLNKLKEAERVQTKGKKGILVVTNTFVENNLLPFNEYFLFIDKLVKSLSKTGMNISFKLHPREKYAGRYEKILLSNKVKGKVYTGKDKEGLYSLIKESKVVVGFFSTSLVETALLGVPSIQINLIDQKTFFSPVLHDRLLIVHVSKDENFGVLVKDIMKNKVNPQDRQKFIKKYIFKLDYKAQNRALAVIKGDLKL